MLCSLPGQWSVGGQDGVAGRRKAVGATETCLN